MDLRKATIFIQKHLVKLQQNVQWLIMLFWK